MSVFIPKLLLFILRAITCIDFYYWYLCIMAHPLIDFHVYLFYFFLRWKMLFEIIYHLTSRPPGKTRSTETCLTGLIGSMESQQKLKERYGYLWKSCDCFVIVSLIKIFLHHCFDFLCRAVAIFYVSEGWPRARAILASARIRNALKEKIFMPVWNHFTFSFLYRQKQRQRLQTQKKPSRPRYRKWPTKWLNSTL